MEKELQDSEVPQKFTRLPGHDYKRIILLISIVLIILAIPLVIYFIQQNQDTRQRAEVVSRPIIDQGTNITAFPDIGGVDGPCHGFTAGQACNVTVTHVKGFDSANQNDLFVTSGNGKYWIYSPINGGTRTLTTGDLTTAFPDLGGVNGPCHGKAAGTCVVGTVTHVKGFDSANQNELFVTAEGKYWRYSPITNGTRTIIDQGNLDTAFPDLGGVNGPCHGQNAGACNTIATVSHVKGYDSATQNELFVTSMGKYWRYGPLTNGTRAIIDQGDLTSAFPDSGSIKGVCSGKPAGACNLNNVAFVKGFDSADQNELFVNDDRGNYFRYGPLPATTTTATGTPPAGSPTPTVVINPTSPGTLSCAVSFTFPVVNTPNTAVTILMTKESPAATSNLWEYLTLYELDPDTGKIRNNFGGCPNNVCTLPAAYNSVGVHRFQIAVRDNATYGTKPTPTPSIDVRLPGQTEPQIWCAVQGASSFTTGATGTSTVTPTTTPAPGSIQLKFNDNIKLQGNSRNLAALGTPPVTPTKTLSVELYDANDDTTLVAKGSGPVTYNTTSTNFGTGTGIIWVTPISPTSTFPAGTYRVKVKVDKYLKKWAPGTITVPTTGATTAPIAVSPNSNILLLGGDIANQNIINITGYNALIDCGAASYNPLPQINSIANALKIAACRQHLTTDPAFNVAMLDLNDDGFIDSIDYQILTGNLLYQNGD